MHIDLCSPNSYPFLVLPEQLIEDDLWRIQNRNVLHCAEAPVHGCTKNLSGLACSDTVREKKKKKGNTQIFFESLYNGK